MFVPDWSTLSSSFDPNMRSFTSLLVLITIIGKIPSISSSINCVAVGGDDDGNGVAVECNSDATANQGPLPNVTQQVGALTVYSSNASDDVHVDPASVESLKFQGCASEIPDHAFAGFRSLRQLILDFGPCSNGVSRAPQVNLKHNAFKGLEWKLKRLELIDINLSGAGGFPAAIRPLSALEVLKFEDCNLKGSLKGQDLQQLKSLRRFEIINSPDCFIGDDIFSKNGDTLERVIMDNVQLKTMPTSVASCKSLREFQCRHTAITSVPAVFQPSGTTLKELRLSDNAISSIDAGAFKGLSALTLLALSGNQISTLPRGCFDDLASCETLQLSSNRLTTASVQNAFANMKALKSISLGDNQLDSITPATLAGTENTVTSFYFSGNKIKSVRGTSKLTQSPQFALASNGITALNSQILEKDSTFSELILDSNPISTIHPDGFNAINVGKAFSVDDTSLTEFDLSSLSGMQGVQNLSILDNADLKTIKVSSESVVPQTLRYIIIDNNPRLILDDANGKFASYIQKSKVQIIVKNRIFCNCQLGWLRKWPKSAGDRKSSVVFATTNDFGDVTPTQCCNLDGVSGDNFLTDSEYNKHCKNNADKGSGAPTDDDHC